MKLILLTQPTCDLYFLFNLVNSHTANTEWKWNHIHIKILEEYLWKTIIKIKVFKQNPIDVIKTNSLLSNKQQRTIAQNLYRFINCILICFITPSLCLELLLTLQDWLLVMLTLGLQRLVVWQILLTLIVYRSFPWFTCLA